MADTELQKTVTGTPATAQSRTYFSPRCDICESKEGLVLLADMPGVAENSVEIVFEKGILTITGRVSDGALKDHELKTHEYPVGDFRRQFTLSDVIDVSGIEASMANGVLRLGLPKAEAAKPKRIAVTQK